MADSIQILIFGYTFTNPNTPLEQRNLYNTSAPVEIIPPIGGLDITGYLLERPSLSFNRITNDNSGEYPLAVFEYGDITLKLDGIRNNKYLQNYFLIYDTSSLWSFRKYRIDYKVNGSVVFSGYVNNDSIRENFGFSDNPDELKIINLQAISRDKELREWLKVCTLPHPSAVFKSGNSIFPLPWTYDERSEDAGTDLCSSVYLDVLFRAITGIQTTCWTFFGWQYCNIPQLFNTEWSGNWFIKSGYKRWYEEGFTVFEFINAFQNATGTMLELAPNQYGAYTLHLRKRSDTSGTVVTLDFNKVKSWLLGSSSAAGVKNIVVPSGQLKSQTGIAGFILDDDTLSRHIKLVSSSGAINLQTNPFNRIAGNAGIGSSYHYSMILDNYFRFLIKTGDSDKLYKWAHAWKLSETPYSYDYERRTFKLSETLVLNAGEQTAMKTVCNFTNTHNYPAAQMGADWQDVIFHGNVGDGLVRQSGWFVTEDYHSYCKGVDFRNNFISMLEGGAARTVELEYIEELYNPKCIIQFSNVPLGQDFTDFFSLGSFAVNSLETNGESRESKLLLVRL